MAAVEGAIYTSVAWMPMLFVLGLVAMGCATGAAWLDVYADGAIAGS